VLLVALRGYGAETEPPCLAPGNRYLPALTEQLKVFKKEVERASLTSRTILSIEYGRLQRIRRKTALLKAPPCAAPLERDTLEAMDKDILTVRAFLRMDGVTLRKWERASDAERAKMLERQRADLAWKLVAFEIKALRERPTLQPAVR
jgi:hypothetical protein